MAALLASSSAYAEFKPPHEKPGPAVDKVGFRAYAIEIVPLAMEKGEIDLYIFPLRTATAKEMILKPGVKMYEAPASSVSIILNPAPAPKGELNPLSIREVRYALQFIIDREFIANEIYRGLATPQITHVSPFDFDYLTVYDLIKESGIRYDPEFAKKIVKDALLKAGAVEKDGKWFYEDKPIRLKFIVRVEDERRDIGDLVARELERLGFVIETVYHPFATAIHKVYGTDPRLFEWHLYIEGWGKASTERYDYATINQMCAPWFGSMPGWQEVGFWQYENPKLDELGKKIFLGGFKSLKERNELYRELTLLSLNESVRLWVATVRNNFPAIKGLLGVSGDIASGPKGIWTLREAYIEGKNELMVGSLWVWTERSTWNPIGGFQDVYSVDIWRNVHDPPIWRHPFTGIPMPFRARYKVETAGPDGTLKVPSDAFVWDGKLSRWREVGYGVEAKSKVVYDYSLYLKSKWHHGEPIALADVIYSLYQTFDIAYNPDKSKVEFAIATTSKPYLDTFKGFRILNETAIEVYVDYWHFIPEYIAEYAHPLGLSTPWEVLAAMDSLVFEKRMAAYSDTAAEKFQVPWLSLVMDKDARLVKMALTEFLDKGFVPKALELQGRALVSKEEAANRYRAAIGWFDKYAHMVISNGPFFLAKFDPASQYAELRAFRDPTYPFKPGRWYFGTIPSIELSSPKGEIVIGSDSKFEVKVQGQGRLGLRYLLFDPQDGKVLKLGEAAMTDKDTFSFTIPSNITSKLRPASYNLFLVAYSDESSMVGERVEVVKALTAPIEKPEGKPPVTTTENPSEKAPQEVQEKAPEIGGAWLWLGPGIVVIVAAGLALLLRKKKHT
ncbi:MAG: ABC transporter substrate-binding protein [Nitrososphaerota archaeon]